MADLELVRVDDGMTSSSLSVGGSTVFDGLVKAYQLQPQDWADYDAANEDWKGYRIRGVARPSLRFGRTLADVVGGSDESVLDAWDRYILRFASVSTGDLWPRGYFLCATPGGVGVPSGSSISPTTFDNGRPYVHPLFKPTSVTDGVVNGEWYDFGCSDAGDVPVYYGRPNLASVDVSASGLSWQFTPTHFLAADGPQSSPSFTGLIRQYNGFLVGHPGTAGMSSDWRVASDVLAPGDRPLARGDQGAPAFYDDAGGMLDSLTNDLFIPRGSALPCDSTPDWRDPYGSSDFTDDGWRRLASWYIHGLHIPANILAAIGSHYGGSGSSFNWRVVTRSEWWNTSASWTTLASGTGTIGTAFIQTVSLASMPASGGLVELHWDDLVDRDGVAGTLWTDALAPYTLHRGVARERSSVYLPGLVWKAP